MSEPLLSVVVAVFQGARNLQRCVDSVLAQTYPHRELIIIDGGSTDGTVEILRRNTEAIAYWHSKPDRGIYDALNQGIRRARGDWILVLGADDFLWTPGVLNEAAQRLRESYPPYRVVYGQVAVLDSAARVITLLGRPWGKSKRRFLHEMVIPHTGTFQHRSLFEVHGYFRNDFRICGDYELLLRELRHRDALFLEGLVVTGMQFGGISSLPTLSLLGVRECERARRLNGLSGFSFWLFLKSVRARVRSGLRRVFGERISDAAADLYRVSTAKPRLWTRKGPGDPGGTNRSGGPGC